MPVKKTSNRPELPAKLRKELDKGENEFKRGGHGRRFNRRRTKPTRKEIRKAARDEKKQKKNNKNWGNSGERNVRTGNKKRKRHGEAVDHSQSNKKAKKSIQTAPGATKRTTNAHNKKPTQRKESKKRVENDDPHQKVVKPIDPELQKLQEEFDLEQKIQKRLAKQLGMKSRDTIKKKDSFGGFLPGFGSDNDQDNDSLMEDDEVDGSLLESLEEISDDGSGLGASSDVEIIDKDGDSMEGLGSLSGEELSAEMGAEDGIDSEECELEDSEEGLEGSESGGDDSDAVIENEQEGVVQTGKYVPPALRGKLGDGSDGALARRVRGLLNRLAETNIQGIVNDVVALYEKESRSTVSKTVCEEIIKAASKGPRATDKFVGVAAALISGISAQAHAQQIAARFLSDLAVQLDASYSADDSLGCRNTVGILCHCYLCGLVGSELLFSFLDTCIDRFDDQDISMMYILLQACGFQLRAEDPVRMKDFVVGIHQRAAEATKQGKLSQRGEVMLDLVVDIKNNRKRDAKGAFKMLSPTVSKWLKEVGVSSVYIGQLSWTKLTNPNKKGLWWLPDPGKTGGVGRNLSACVDDVNEGTELLKLAAAFRMNTDVRKAIFCVVMGSQDFADAFDRLLRLPLKGEQQREVVRVVVECCLGEKNWNPYYAHLLGRLCSADQSHAMTLQYCLWDQFKEVEGLELRRMDNLARLAASTLYNKLLPLKILKVVDFAVMLDASNVLFWQIFFVHLILGFKDQDDLIKLFSRLSMHDHFKALQKSLLLFFRQQLGPFVANLDPSKVNWIKEDDVVVLLKRMRKVEKALVRERV